MSSIFGRFLRPKRERAAEAQAVRVRPEWRLPKCIPIDENKVTDFGQQVATLLTLEANKWYLKPDLRVFHHVALGTFEFNDEDVLFHAGFHGHPGETGAPGRQRVLTRADQEIICEALAALATSGMDTTPEPQVVSAQSLASSISQLSSSTTLAQAAVQAAVQNARINQNAMINQMAKQSDDPSFLRRSIKDEYQNHMADALNYGTSVLAVDPGAFGKLANTGS